MLLLPILLLMAGGAAAFSSGNVGVACRSMTPGHFLTSSQRSAPPYAVTAKHYDRGFYIVTVEGKDVFAGFFLQAHDPRNEKIVGIFTEVQGGKIIDCDYNGGAIAHDGSYDKRGIRALWYPNGYRGPVIFKSTIVKSYSKYWTNIYSNLLQV